MRPDVLFKRYEKYGYNGNPNVQTLIRWLYVVKRVHVGVTYCTMNFPAQHGKPSPFRRFWGHFIPFLDSKDKFVNSYTGLNTFKDPEDAKFDALRRLLRSMHVLTVLNKPDGSR